MPVLWDVPPLDYICFWFFFKYFTNLSQNISLGITKISNILDKHEGSLSTQ